LLPMMLKKGGARLCEFNPKRGQNTKKVSQSVCIHIYTIAVVLLLNWIVRKIEGKM
jgi:hypothetical protein